MMIRSQEKKAAIQTELESTRGAFHALLAALTQEDFRKQSRNPGWTNGEILAHMLFGFMILRVLLPMVRCWGRLPKAASKPFAGLLNALTVPFNGINALGARLQAHVFTRQKMGKLFDWAYSAITKQLNAIQDDEWARGMHYPTRWDPNFQDFMTIEDLFHYSINHFNLHREQIVVIPMIE